MPTLIPTDKNIRAGVLFKYNDSVKIYKCPSDTFHRSATGARSLASAASR